MFVEKQNFVEFSELANNLSEIDEELVPLIQYCVRHDIETLGSCQGHPEDEELLHGDAYVLFSFSQDLYDCLEVFPKYHPYAQVRVVGGGKRIRLFWNINTIPTPVVVQEVLETFKRWFW